MDEGCLKKNVVKVLYPSRSETPERLLTIKKQEIGGRRSALG